MNLAIISVCALALAVLVSCVSRLNVGVLSIALAWIVGVYIGGMPVTAVMSGLVASTSMYRSCSLRSHRRTAPSSGWLTTPFVSVEGTAARSR